MTKPTNTTKMYTSPWAFWAVCHCLP